MGENPPLKIDERVHYSTSLDNCYQEMQRKIDSREMEYESDDDFEYGVLRIELCSKLESSIKKSPRWRPKQKSVSK